MAEITNKMEEDSNQIASITAGHMDSQEIAIILVQIVVIQE